MLPKTLSPRGCQNGDTATGTKRPCSSNNTSHNVGNGMSFFLCKQSQKSKHRSHRTQSHHSTLCRRKRGTSPTSTVYSPLGNRAHSANPQHPKPLQTNQHNNNNGKREHTTENIIRPQEHKPGLRNAQPEKRRIVCNGGEGNNTGGTTTFLGTSDTPTAPPVPWMGLVPRGHGATRVSSGAEPPLKVNQAIKGNNPDYEYINEPWPLHTPTPPTPTYTLVADILKDPYITITRKQSFEYLHDVKLYQCSETTKATLPITKLTQDQIRDMIEKGYLNETKHKPNGYMFLKPEPIKQRHRVIHDTVLPNLTTPDPPNPKFRTIWQLRELVHKGNWAAAIDFKCYYYHFPLAKDVQKHFTITTGDTNYSFTRLPMGFKWAVIIAHTATNFLTRQLTWATAVDTYIDNVLIITNTKQQLLSTYAEIRDRCEHYGVQIGDTEWGQTVTHRGVVLDFVNKTTGIREATTLKIQQKWDKPDTWGKWRSLIGTQIYAQMGTGRPLATLFHLIKWYARNALKHPNNIATPWTQAALEMISAKRQNSNTFKVRNPTHPGSIIFTDAATSTNLIAATWITENGEQFTCTKEGTHTNIADLETEAIWMAITTVGNINNRTHTLCTDSTVAYYALTKGYSRNFTVNQLIIKILRYLGERNAQVYVLYVPSDTNPADAPTRNAQLSEQQQKLIDWAKTLNTNLRSASRWVEMARKRFKRNY
eukprot:PhM_4_TR18096/c2_g1_i2/m.49138